MIKRLPALLLLILLVVSPVSGQESTPKASSWDVGPLPEGWTILEGNRYECDGVGSAITIVWLTDGTSATEPQDASETGDAREDNLSICGLLSYEGGTSIHEVYDRCGDTRLEVKVTFPQGVVPDETFLAYPCWVAEPGTIDPSRVDVRELYEINTCDSDATLKFMAYTRGEISEEVDQWNVRVRSMPCMADVKG